MASPRTASLLALLVLIGCSGQPTPVAPSADYWYGIVVATNVAGDWTVELAQSRECEDPCFAFAYGGYDSAGVRQRLDDLLNARSG